MIIFYRTVREKKLMQIERIPLCACGPGLFVPQIVMNILEGQEIVTCVKTVDPVLVSLRPIGPTAVFILSMNAVSSTLHRQFLKLVAPGDLACTGQEGPTQEIGVMDPGLVQRRIRKTKTLFPAARAK